MCCLSGALWKCGWGPLTSERGLLRQEEVMGQAHSGQPWWQSWVGSRLLTCSPSQLGASLEWAGGGLLSVCWGPDPSRATVLGDCCPAPGPLWTSDPSLRWSGLCDRSSETPRLLRLEEGRENPGSRGNWLLSSPWPGPRTVGFRASWPLPASLLVGGKGFPPSDLDPSSPTNAQPQPLSL